MLQMPPTQATEHSPIYVEQPDIPAGLTISDYRLSRPRTVAWWRQSPRTVALSLMRPL
jgi:hypothetical protein